MLEKELLEKYGSPIYVYDENILTKRATELLNLKNYLESELNLKVSMHYSTKANNNLHLLKIIKSLGMQADSMSPIELQLAQKAGFDNNEIIYVCNNISQDEMKSVVDQGVLLCMDSVEQIKLLGEVRPNTEIVIRLNPEDGGVGESEKVITAGKDARFGITEKDFDELLKVVKKYNIQIIGIHQHLGSCFLDKDIEQYMCGLRAGIELANKYFPNISIFDLGGGFGVPYNDADKRLNFENFAQEVVKNLREVLKNTQIKELKFEPGRYIVCESSCILGTVNSLKQSFSKLWVGTDIGMNVLIRPALYGAKHKIEILTESKKSKYVTTTIAGNICEPGDVLGENVEIEEPEIGDVIKVYDTGAYGYCMSSDYTGRLAIAEILIDKDGNDRIIRRKETIDDVLSRF